MTLVADFNPAVAVTFQRMRALLLEGGGGLQEGVLGAGDLKGSQRAAGANLSADVAAGAAWVTIDTGARNGGTHIYNDAVFNAGPFSAGHATLPRIDQVVLRYNDSAIPTGAGNTPTIEVLTGTATSGATLDNRLGATALPNDCVRLFDVLMPAVASSVTTANIRDRRPWARGALAEILYAGGNGSVTSTAFAVIPTVSAGIQQRVECSSAPLIVEWSGHVNSPAAAAAYMSILPTLDGNIAYGTGGAVDDVTVYTVAASSQILTVTRRYRLAPAAGSHLVSLVAKVTSGTGTVVGSAGDRQQRRHVGRCPSVAVPGSTARSRGGSDQRPSPGPPPAGSRAGSG
jgi:hypothetical protein